MAKTLSQLTREIEALSAKADALRAREVTGVIGRIKLAIDAYGLTAQDLGFGSGASGGTAISKSKAKAKVGRSSKSNTVAKSSRDAKYQDGAGNSWGGRGPRPAWLKAALESGRALESLSVDNVGTVAKPGVNVAAPNKPARAKQKTLTLAAPAKYADGTGNKWTGRGPRPAWFKKSIAAGRSLEQLAA